MALVIEAVCSNSGGVISIAELGDAADFHNEDYFNLIEMASSNRELRDMLSTMAEGDTIQIRERWSEDV